jgi:hypothetical protein
MDTLQRPTDWIEAREYRLLGWPTYLPCTQPRPKVGAGWTIDQLASLAYSLLREHISVMPLNADQETETIGGATASLSQKRGVRDHLLRMRSRLLIDNEQRDSEPHPSATTSNELSSHPGQSRSSSREHSRSPRKSRDRDKKRDKSKRKGKSIERLERKARKAARRLQRALRKSEDSTISNPNAQVPCPVASTSSVTLGNETSKAGVVRAKSNAPIRTVHSAVIFTSRIPPGEVTLEHMQRLYGGVGSKEFITRTWRQL